MLFYKCKCVFNERVFLTCHFNKRPVPPPSARPWYLPPSLAHTHQIIQHVYFPQHDQQPTGTHRIPLGTPRRPTSLSAFEADYRQDPGSRRFCGPAGVRALHARIKERFAASGGSKSSRQGSPVVALRVGQGLVRQQGWSISGNQGDSWYGIWTLAGCWRWWAGCA